MKVASFWDGFEKRAASVVGELPGITSGLRQFANKAKGIIKAPKPPVPGETIGPRSSPVPLPTPKAQPGSGNSFVPLTRHMPRPKIPKHQRIEPKVAPSRL